MIDHEKMRPYWHVDAKWICGLLLLGTLGGGLLLTTLATLTGPKYGPEFAATAIASAFSREGLDAPLNAEEMADMRRKLAASKTGAFAPIPNFPSATITAADLNLSPREIRLKIFRQIAAPIYDKGIEGAAREFTKDPAQQEKFARDAFMLQLFTRDTHERLKQWAWVGLGVSVLLVAGVIFFSAGWGRLANLGILLVMIALPGAVIGLGVIGMAQGEGSPLRVVPAAVLPDLAAGVRSTYGPVALLGLGLLVAAGAGKAVSAARRVRDNGGEARPRS